MRLLIRGAALAGLLLSCFSPSERDGVIHCGPEPAPCPPGYACAADGLCWRGTPDGGLDLGPEDAPPGGGEPDARRGRKPACSDGIDNDCDGLIDWPADPGCSGPDDDDEHGSGPCDDGIDNDHDGRADYHVEHSTCGPGDPDCKSPTDDSEAKK